MSQKQTCSPTSIHGPKEQVVFLGASVQSVSTSLGWNEQQSTLTVTLVEDNCTGPKVYYPLPGQRFTTNAADPGFIKPTIGTPVYFRMGGSTGSSSDIFEFAGIVQAWTVDASSSANPVYTVTIVDPRIILSNLEVIVSDYAGEVGDVYNLINAYGWLESQGTSCPWTAVNGSYFGSPANGFGGAVNNNEGTPYVLLRNSIQRLLSGFPDAKYSPYGYACYRAPNGVSDVASDGRAYGMVFSPQDTNDSALSAAGGYGPVANYYVDLSEIPFAPTFYRIPGPSISVLDLVSQICAETGCDYYIELLITSTGQKCIKVRVAERATQPSLGEIESFVTSTDNVIAKNVGRELRNEPSQGFVYGGYVQTVYQQSAASSRIIQFWGYDSAKNLTVADNTSLTGREEGDWKIYLDIRPLSASMTVPIVGDSIPGYGSYGAHYIEIHEKEIRMAIGGFDEWFNYAIAYNQGAGTEFGQWVRGNLNIQGPNIHFPNFTGMGIGPDALSAALLNMIGYNLAFQPDQDPTDNRNEDLKKIHQFIVDWAETYYGKQFLVQLPYVCYRTDSDSGQVIYSDNPTNDGGWPAQGITDVLKLPCSTEGQPGEKLSFFADETNKVTPFCRFYEIGTGVGSGVIVQQDEYIAHNASDGRGLSVYLKGAVDEKPLEYGAYATAIFKLDSPVIESGLEKDLGGINPNFAGLIETAITSGVSGANLNVLKGGLQFNADGTRGSDGTLAIAIKRKTPDEVAVPMKSNTVRYGPIFKKGPPGQVHFVADDQLVPWEYDGYLNLMNAPGNAMLEKIRDSVTYMQEGERGSINFPGTPTRRLGSELRSTQKTMNFMNMQATSFSAGGGSHTYNGIASVPWNGSFGPNITNITVNYGENGFTTAYTLNTFTPSFGKFAKYNANRLSKMGKRAQEVRKIQRERNKLQKALAEANERASSARKQMKQRSKQNATNGTNMTVGTVGEMAVSGIPETGQQAMGISRVSPRQLALGNSSGWLRQGGMSDDALFTPITQRQHPDYGEETQPMYDTLSITGYCSGNSNQATMALPPINGWDYKKSGLRYMGTKVSGDYLDPFAIVSTPKHNEENQNGPNNHTHIVNVVHGQVPAGAAAMEAYKLEEGDFPNALRPMAHKGPLMLHGWGYDLNGKPIPNLNDIETHTKLGHFIKTGEANFFLDHHLRKPETWPVGPIDLRFDKQRGVWTTPIQYKIIQVHNTGGDIEAGGGRDDLRTLNMASTEYPYYDSGGEPYTSGHIELTNPSWGAKIASGEKLFAFWDSLDCTYYPLFSSGSGSDLCYLNSGTCMDTLAYGCLDESSKITSRDTIVFGSGIKGTNITVKYDTPFSGHCGLTGHNYGGERGISGTDVDAISIDVRLPVYNSSTGLVGGTEQTCVDKWEQMKFSDCQFALYTGNYKGCDYVEISGRFPQIIDTSGACQPLESESTLYDKPLNFSMLRFGSGLQLSGNGDCYGMGGDYTLNAFSNIKWESYQGTECVTDLPAIQGNATGINFRSGLIVTQDPEDPCKIHVDARTRISGGYRGCPSDGSEYYDVTKTDLTTYEPFRNLVFGTGLVIDTLQDDCTYQISSQPSIPWSSRQTTNCITTDAAIGGYFTGINFRSGLMVEVDSENPCHINVDAKTRIKGGMTGCKPGDDYQIDDWKWYRNLLVGSGLKLKQNQADCEYEIQGVLPHLKGTNACGYHTTPGGPFDSLNFGTGFEIIASQSEYCDYDINVGMYIKGGRTGCHDTSDEITTYKPYTRLSVGSGLVLDELDSCTYSLDLAPGTRLFSGIAFGNIIPRTGLRFTPHDGQFCDFYLDALAISGGSTGCSGGPDRIQSPVSVTQLQVTGNGLKLEDLGNGTVALSHAPGRALFSGFEFGNIIPRSGLSFVRHTENNDCDWFLDVHAAGSGRIKGGMTGCKPGTNYQINDWVPYKDLLVGSGLKLKENVEDSEYEIQGILPHLKGTNACGYHTTPGGPFDSLNFGTGFEIIASPSEYCDYDINVGMYIKGGRTGCHDNADEIPNYKPYTRLSVGSGLVLDELDSCTYSLDLAPGTRLFSGIAFGNIIPRNGLSFARTQGGQDCDWYLDSTAGALYAGHSGTCMSSNAAGCVDTINAIGTFNDLNLIMGKGITGVNTAMNDAQRTALGFQGGNALEIRTRLPIMLQPNDQHATGDTTTDCIVDWEQIKFPENQFTLFEGHTSGCDYVTVSGKFGSVQDLVVAGDDCTPQFHWKNSEPCSGFDCLAFGTGLSVDDMGGGKFRIDASVAPRFANATACNTNAYNQIPNATSDRYQKITFGTGLKAGEYDSTKPCEITLNSTFSIKGGMTGCKPNGTNETISASVGGAVTETAQLLHFSDGLKVTRTATGCEYKITAPQPTINTNVFDNITLGTGLQLREIYQGDGVQEYCDYTLDVSMLLKGGMTGCKPVGTNYTFANYVPFKQIVVGNGLKVAGSNGTYTLSAPQPEIDGNIFDNIRIGTGLHLQTYDGYCDFTLNTDHQIKGGMSGCKPGGDAQVADFEVFEQIEIGNGLKLGMAGSKATITAPQPTIGGNIFDSLTVGSGLELAGNAEYCDFTINSKLKFKSCQGNQVGSNRIEEITLGAGLSGTASSNSITVGLNKSACSGAPTKVDVVRGIACVGSGFEVQMKRLYFTSEGLFIGSENI